MSETTAATLQKVQERDSWPQALRVLLSWRVLGAIGLFIVLAMVFQYQSDGVFLSSRNISLMLRQGALVAVVACGVAVLMIMAEIDLSIGSAVFLCGIVGATAQTEWGMSVPATVVLMVMTGLLLGAWQGFWVARVMVPSFIVTLAGMLIFRGIGLTWSEAKTISSLQPGFINLSEGFLAPLLTTSAGVAVLVIGALVYGRRIRRDKNRHESAPIPTITVRMTVLVIFVVAFVVTMNGYMGAPMAVLWALVVGALLAFAMNNTPFGRNAYMIGANREAARLSGVRVRAHIFGGFVLMGLVYAIGGILLTANVGAATPTSGQFLELDAIAAAVIGGVSLFGGIGRIPAVLVGALLLTMIDNGMTVMNISSFTQDIVKGGILLVAVALDMYAKRNLRSAST